MKRTIAGEKWPDEPTATLAYGPHEYKLPLSLCRELVQVLRAGRHEGNHPRYAWEMIDALDSLIAQMRHTLDLEHEVERARVFASEVHAGQVYHGKDGDVPYMQHCEAVAALVDLEDKALALLHDVIEDGPEGTDERLRSIFGWELVGLVKELSRREGEAYSGYIKRVCSHPKARRVKKADLTVNLANCEGRPEYKALEKRYIAALAVIDVAEAMEAMRNE